MHRFRGFLGGLWVGGQLYRFATYTGAVIERIQVLHSVGGGSVGAEIVIRTAQHRLELNATGNHANAAVLYGPAPGGRFVPYVREMLGAELRVRLTSRSDGTVLFDAIGLHAGFELESIIANHSDPSGRSTLDYSDLL